MDLSGARDASSFRGQLEGIHAVQLLPTGETTCSPINEPQKKIWAHALGLRSFTKEHTCPSMNDIVKWQGLPVRTKKILNANLQSHFSGALIPIKLNWIKKEITFFSPPIFIHSRMWNDLHRLQKYIQLMFSVCTAYFSCFSYLET